MSSEEKTFEDVVKAIKALESFPFDNYANRLHNKARMELDWGLQEHVEQAPNYPADDPDPDSPYLGIYSAVEFLFKLSIPSVCSGIAPVSNDVDPNNVRQYVSADNSHIRFLEAVTSLMGCCLGEYIDRQLKSRNVDTLDVLRFLDPTRDYILQAVASQNFILNEVRTDMARQDHLFSIAFLLIADYLQDGWPAYRDFLASGSEFRDRASYKTLTQWSYTLWSNEGRGDPARMDEIVKFCGRAATIGLCPPNTTTGLQSPAPTFDVTKAFYEMGSSSRDDDEYDRDIQASLSRLQDQEDIVNEWKSYCDALTNSWENEIIPYWKTGMYRAFQADKWYEMLMWESVTYDRQADLFGTDYLPLTSKPNLGFRELSESSILPGTLITLLDGTSRPAETLQPGEEILICQDPKTSAPVYPRRIKQPGKAKLFGFNGEIPWFPGSQVFHTTTGLRAVDPEGAQRLNSYQRIGTLAVGHIVFRLQGGEYAAAEVKSIQKTTKTTHSEFAYALSLAGEQNHTYYAHGYLVDANISSYTLRETAEKLRKVPGSMRLALLAHCQELWSTFQKFDFRAIYQRLNWELFGHYAPKDEEEPLYRASVQPFSYEDHLKTSEALSVTQGVAIDRLTRGFSLTAYHPSRLPAGYQLPTLSLVDGYLLVQDEVQFRSTYDPRTRCFRWTRELKSSKLFEHGAVEIHPHATSGMGVVYLSSELEARKTPSRDQVHPFKASGRSLEQLHASNVADEWTSFGQWEVTLDQSVWPPDTDRTEPEDPIDGGLLEDGFWTNEQGVELPGIRSPLVDNLRDEINGHFEQELGDFYQGISRFKDGEQKYYLQFSHAPLLPFISDAGLDVNKTFDVGFKSDLGIDITLPSLYQDMEITMDALYTGFTGYFFEYDPTKRGNRGNRHLVTGTAKWSSAVDSYRSKVSHAYMLALEPGKAAAFYEQHQPASVTNSLLALADVPNLTDLMTLAGYQENSIHNDTQLLIRSMMYYHMDDTQREKILQVPKPNENDLPASLADNLPSQLKTFFKEKYGPAFICRYVGRTQKYMKSFTDQEMKDLWYWWQGNGENTLSHSEEYNDINRLSSREAMMRRNAKKLEPYLTSDPDDWATQLYNMLTTNKRLLRTFVHFPIQDGNNVINKQCNILDALSPGGDWSNKFFDEFLTFTMAEGSTYADIEPDDDQDTKYQWLHDSMHDLIVAVLNDDDKISEDIKKGLQADIDEFEKQNGLNQQADAEQRASAILEKSTLFMQELAGWFSYIGKGMSAAFGGTALWKWAGEAFEQVAAKFPSLKGVSKLKGLCTASMVAVGLLTAAVSLWGLVNSWDSMSAAARAVVIIEVSRMILDSASKAVDAWNSYRSNPAGSPAEELNMQALGDSLTQEVMDSSETVGEVAEKIAGGEDYRVVIGEGLHSEGLPTESEGEMTWNESLEELAQDVPPGYEDVAKKFNISGNVLRILNAILGIGLVIAMSFSLANDWNSMSDAGKVLGILNIIVQGLTVLLDVVEAGTAAGLWAVTGTMSVVLPILGAVLAVVGVILMMVQLFINLFVAKQDPPDPIRDFIDDVGHKVIRSFGAAPPALLQYSISGGKVNAGQVVTLSIKGENKSSDEVTLSYVAITLYSGDDDVCLFRNGADETANIQLVPDTDSNKDKNGYTYATPSDTVGSQLPAPAKLGSETDYYEYNLQVAGPPKETSSSLNTLVLKAGESFQSFWTAKVNSKGPDAERSLSWVEVVENGLVDRCQSHFSLSRI
ncbi:hypothetical protein F4782DRAFT_475448 [Xylaria castorea]|nr:hypothetical protein F4782DRAFT_475448 [Xylaria castorea]